MVTTFKPTLWFLEIIQKQNKTKNHSTTDKETKPSVHKNVHCNVVYDFEKLQNKNERNNLSIQH